MRIAVECGGFRDAAEACHTANHVAALVTESLAGKLGGYAGMAGDDSTSVDFASSYDEGAREALATLAELTHAFIGLGRLLRSTGANHAAAEAASAGRRADVDDGRDDEGRDDAWRHVAPDDPPSSLGADEPSLGEIDRWILDRVEGFVWPGADVSLLRDAALTWQRTATTVERLTSHLDVVEPLLRRQESPEVPVAIEVVASLRDLVVTVADELVALGQACDDYADSVEETHDRTRALLAEVGQMIVEGVLVSAVVGAVTGGLGASGSIGATVARIRAQAPRFHALLVSARAAGSVGASRVRAARDSLVKVRGELERFARVPARNDRGSAVNPLGRFVGKGTPRRPPEVEDPKLGNYVANLFKGADNPNRVGDGTTMDAIRHELRTGETVHQRRHLTKGRETVQGLENWLDRHPDASSSDRSVAQSLIAELKEALSS